MAACGKFQVKDRDRDRDRDMDRDGDRDRDGDGDGDRNRYIMGVSFDEPFDFHLLILYPGAPVLSFYISH